MSRPRTSSTSSMGSTIEVAYIVDMSEPDKIKHLIQETDLNEVQLRIMKKICEQIAADRLVESLKENEVDEMLRAQGFVGKDDQSQAAKLALAKAAQIIKGALTLEPDKKRAVTFEDPEEEQDAKQTPKNYFDNMYEAAVQMKTTAWREGSEGRAFSQEIVEISKTPEQRAKEAEYARVKAEKEAIAKAKEDAIAKAKEAEIAKFVKMPYPSKVEFFNKRIAEIDPENEFELRLDLKKLGQEKGQKLPEYLDELYKDFDKNFDKNIVGKIADKILALPISTKDQAKKFLKLFERFDKDAKKVMCLEVLKRFNSESEEHNKFHEVFMLEGIGFSDILDNKINYIAEQKASLGLKSGEALEYYFSWKALPPVANPVPAYTGGAKATDHNSPVFVEFFDFVREQKKVNVTLTPAGGQDAKSFAQKTGAAPAVNTGTAAAGTVDRPKPVAPTAIAGTARSAEQLTTEDNKKMAKFANMTIDEKVKFFDQELEARKLGTEEKINLQQYIKAARERDEKAEKMGSKSAQPALDLFFKVFLEKQNKVVPVPGMAIASKMAATGTAPVPKSVAQVAADGKTQGGGNTHS